MATTVQNIVTRHKSEGAKKVQSDTEMIGKAQTRLGQASASAGRQFSAQATGLGGIVSAYAGAAANIFALTAAFFALQRSAEFEQIISGTQQLASTIGESGNNIINTVQNITKAQLSLLETAQQVNLGLSAGFNTQQIEQLSDVSLRASKALGRNLSDAFQRGVRGAAKLEPELLDELGIFTRIDPAVRKYADSVGRSVTSLTNFERRQAFVNAVIEEGQRKFRDVDTATDTAAQSLSKLSATIVDLGLKLGSFLANVLTPFADFLTNNTSNAIALFGLLARVIGAQAINVFGSAINEVAANIQRFGEVTSAALNKSGAGFKRAQTIAAEFSQGKMMLTRFGTQAEQAIKQETRAVLADIQAKKLLTAEEVRLAKAKLQEAIATEKAFISRNKDSKNVKFAELAIRRLTRQIKLLELTQKTASVAGNVFALSLRGIGVAAAFVGATLSKFLGIITTITLALSLFQLAADGLGKVFGFGEVKILESILGFIKDIIDNFNKGARSIGKFGTAFSEEIGDIFRGSGIAVEEQKNQLERVNTVFTKFVRLFGKNTEEANRFFNAYTSQNILQPSQLADKLQGFSPQQVKVFELLTNQFKKIAQVSGNDNARAFLSSLEDLSKSTGVGAAQLVGALAKADDNFGLLLKSSGVLEVRINGIGTDVGKIVDGAFKFKEGLEEAGKGLVVLGKLTKQFSDDFNSGALNAEKAAASVSAQENAIARLEKNAETLRGTEKERLENLIQTLKINLEIDRTQARRLQNLEKENKIFEKIFGRPLEKLEQGVLRGTRNQDGSVAISSQAKLANQARELAKIAQRREAIEARLPENQKDLLVFQRAQQKSLKDLVAEQDKNLKNGEFDVSLNEKVVKLKAQIAEREKEINKLNSIQLSEIKKSRDALGQLLLIQIDLESKIEKIVFGFEKQALVLKNKVLDTTAKIRDIQRRDRLEAEKAITKELIAQNTATQGFLKAIGGLNRDEALSFLTANTNLTKDLAGKTRDAAIGAAEDQFKKAERDRKLQQLTSEQQIKTTIEQIDQTINLIQVLNENSVEINKLRKEIAGGGADFIPSISAVSQRSRTFGTGRVGENAEGSLTRIRKQLTDQNKKLFDSQKEANEKELKFKKNQADRAFNDTVRNAERTLTFAKERNKLSVRLFERFNKVITDNVTKGLDDLFDALATGTLTLKNFREGFNQFLFNLLNDIRRQFLRETLTEPLTEFGTSILKSAFGITGQPSGRVPGAKPDMIFNDASGGPVTRMAAGGMMRDRVPTLLEPGDFVMKRSSARSIGTSNLSAMNSTGAMPGNVSVNIVNQGTPQEATEQSEPRFDGEKFVIDIVTRDLRNNGPIRRSLRGAS